MEAINNFLPISGYFKLLLIITTAMFAIAQYYDGRQRKLISTDHDSIWGFELRDIEQNPSMKDVKEEFDRLANIEPINNQTIIILLWILFVTYTFLELLSNLVFGQLNQAAA